MSLPSKGSGFVAPIDAHFFLEPFKQNNVLAAGWAEAGCHRFLQNKFIDVVTAGQVEHVMLEPLLDDRACSCTEAGVRRSCVETERFHSILYLAVIESCENGVRSGLSCTVGKLRHSQQL